MKKAWHIAWKDVKLRARDPSSFIVLLLMPLILILILGSVFQSGFQDKPFKVPVAFVDQDRGELSSILKNEVLKGPELSGMIVLKELDSPEEARNMAIEGKVACAIILPQGMSEEILKGKTATILVVGDPEQSIKAGVAKNIVEQFALEATRRSVILSTAADQLLSRSLIQPSEINGLVSFWMENAPAAENLIEIRKNTAPDQNRPSSAMDYYAVGMGAMYLLFAANYGARSILEEKRRGTTIRLLTMPVEPFAILSGKLLGIALFTLLQFLLIILFSAFVYGVNWGSSIFGIALMALASVFAMSGLGALLASFLRTEGQVASIGPAVAIILAFLGGGMITIYGWPSWAVLISRLTPNRWILEGFLSLMQGNGVKEIALPLSVLGGMGLFFFSIAGLRMRWRGDV